MGLLTNDSHNWIRRAPETGGYGILPAQILTITGTPTGGTLILTHRNLPTAGIAYNANVAAIQGAVNTAWGAGVCTVSGGGALPASPITFTFPSGPTAANPMNQAFPVSANIAGLTGGAPVASWSGGPVWVVMVIDKATTPDNKPNYLFGKEERNSADKYFEDAASQGGALGNWKWSAAVRADQIGDDLAMIGLTDTISTVETGVYDHDFKGGAGDGLSYTVQCFDGKVLWTSCGVVGTELKLTSKSGEAGTDQMDFAGWGYLPDTEVTAANIPTVTYPTFYKKLAPTNTGRLVTIAGVNSARAESWTLTYKRAAKPFYAQQGTIYPARPEFDDRELGGDMKVMLDETTELLAAKAGTYPRALVITMPGVETIGTVNKPHLILTVHAFRYIDYGSQPDAAARGNFKLRAFYNTAAATQGTFKVRNVRSTAYN